MPGKYSCLYYLTLQSKELSTNINHYKPIKVNTKIGKNIPSQNLEVEWESGAEMNISELNSKNSLVVQWIGFHAFTTRVPVQFLVGDLPWSGKLRSLQATGHSQKKYTRVFTFHSIKPIGSTHIFKARNKHNQNACTGIK